MTNSTPSTFNLNQHMARLLMSEPFFASLSRRIDKKEDRSIPTAGVWVNPQSGNFELMYNPEFFASLENDTQRLAILKHEFYYLLNFTDLTELQDGIDRYIRFYNHKRRQSPWGKHKPVEAGLRVGDFFGVEAADHHHHHDG